MRGATTPLGARAQRGAEDEPVVRALGYLGDVDEDELVAATKDEIKAYWRRRQPEIVRNAARFAN